MGFLLRRFLERTYYAIGEMRWWVLALCVIAHAILSFEFMQAAGEDKLSQPVDFIYWYATTAYTVGYGDLSPQTTAGRMVTAFFVFPGAIAAFTTIVAKALNGVASLWRRRQSGKGDYSHMDETILLIGFDPERTPRMIDELHADLSHRHRLVLMTRRELTDPDPRVRYVRASSLTSAADLRRAGAETAKRIAIYADSDEQTLAAALAVGALNKTAHVVCYFVHPEGAELLRHHCPDMECIVAAGAELVARSVSDPGASHVLSALISHLDRSATLFSFEWPSGRTATYANVASSLLEKGATLLATQRKGAPDPAFNPGAEAVIKGGDRVYYVADRRVDAQAVT
jgi:voltage-gated potassium channel